MSLPTQLEVIKRLSECSRLLEVAQHDLANLDEAAVRAMKSRAECRFKPARGRDGKPKAYIVERYVFNFELPR